MPEPEPTLLSRRQSRRDERTKASTLAAARSALRPRSRPAKADQPGPRRTPVSAVFTMTVIAGMFAVSALPAYARVDEPAAIAGPASTAQSINVSSELPSELPVRDQFQVTSSAQMAALIRQQLYLTSGAPSLGDDYPWPFEPTDDEGGPLSQLNYYYRECVDFVAWRLNRDAGYTSAPFKWTWANLTPTGGDGSQWLDAWQRQGWPVSNTPIPGSVAYTGGNHVAYVQQVLDGGLVVVEEYNYKPHQYSQRTIATSTVVAFLYPPPT